MEIAFCIFHACNLRTFTTNPIIWYRGAFTYHEKKSADLPLALFHFLCVVYVLWPGETWSMTLVGRWAHTIGLPIKRRSVYFSMVSKINWKHVAAVSFKRQFKFNFVFRFFFFTYFAFEKFSIFVLFSIFERDLQFFIGQIAVTGSFSQSRRAYFTLDDLYPWKKFMLDLCKSLRHCTNTWMCEAKHHQGS